MAVKKDGKQVMMAMKKRNIFKEWLRGKWQLEWFEASYGNDDVDAKITSNAWEEKERIK